MQQQLKNVVFYAAVTYITQQALHYLVFHNALVQLLARSQADGGLGADLEAKTKELLLSPGPASASSSD